MNVPSYKIKLKMIQNINIYTLTAPWNMILNTGKENMNLVAVGFREKKDVGL